MSRVLNDRPGVCRGHPAGRADRARRARLRAPRPAAQAQRRAWSAWSSPELENPIFPAFAQIIESALAQHGFTPVLCTQTPGGVTEDEYVEMLLDRRSPGSSSSPACTPTPPPTTDRYRKLHRPAAADRAGQRLRRGHRRARSSRCDDRLAGRAGGRPPGLARPPPDRPDLRPGPVPAGAAQDRRLPRRDAAGRGLRTRRASSCRCSASRAAQAAADRAARRAASPASSAAPT